MEDGRQHARRHRARLAAVLALAGLALLAAWLLVRATAEPPRDPTPSPLQARDARREDPVAHIAPYEHSGTTSVRTSEPDAEPEGARAVSELGSASTTRRIAGHVVCERFNGPLAGVIVRPGNDAELSGDGPDSAGVVTGDDGSFLITDAPKACTTLELMFADEPEVRMTRSITALADDIEGLILRLDPGMTLMGTVTAASRPLSGAVIHVNERARATTDGAGRYELRHVRPERRDGRDTCHVQADGAVRETKLLQFPFLCGGSQTLDFRLVPGGALHGLVTDTEGRPVGGTDVRIEVDMEDREGREAPKHLTATTGADGTYVLSGVPPGRFLVQVGMPQYELRLRDGGAAEDESIRTLRIRTSPGPATTPEVNGEAWRGLASRWIGDVRIAAAQHTRLDVTLDRGATLEGRVTDASGDAARGAVVVMQRLWRWPQRYHVTRCWRSSVSTHFVTHGDSVTAGEMLRSTTLIAVPVDESGRFRIEHVPAGELLLLSSSEATRHSPQSTLVRVDGEELVRVDCVVGPGIAWRGLVLDVAGDPIPGVYVSASPMGSPWFQRARSGEDGWFELTGLPASAVMLEVEHAGYRRHAERLGEDAMVQNLVITLLR